LRTHRFVAAAASALTLAGCAQFRDLVNDAGELGGTPAYEEAEEEGGGTVEPFVGLDLEETLAGSLDQMEFLSGLRVAAVTPGSAAETAGVRPNDRLVKADGAAMERREQWSAYLASKKAGDVAQLTIERDGALKEFPVTIGSRGAGAVVVRGAARRFVERKKARVVVETKMDTGGGKPRALCVVVEVAPSSPLKKAGLEAGTRIAELDGVEVNGAGDFARRISELPFGTSVELGVVRGEKLETVDVTLYQPDRELIGFTLWPIIGWEEAADSSKSELTFVDLWFIWLYRYQRKGETKAWSVLRFIEWDSGQGQLSEEPAGGAK
jgi:membrane-associated protease RseP (regulator of RpoE activity)